MICQINGSLTFFVYYFNWFFLRLIITCRLWVIYVREDNYSNVLVTIKRLIWTIWTPMSSVLKKADKLNLSLSLSLMIEWTVYLRLFYPYYMVHAIFVFYCRPYNTLYLCPMLLSFVSWWKWSNILFYFYAEGGELSWRWLCRHRWRRGCRFHNLRCRRRQGRRRGGSLVSVSVFIMYYMHISHQSMTSPYYK